MNQKRKVYCDNCGFEQHCEEKLLTPQEQWDSPDTLHAWTIETCKQCRCEECYEN